MISRLPYETTKRNPITQERQIIIRVPSYSKQQQKPELSKKSPINKKNLKPTPHFGTNETGKSPSKKSKDPVVQNQSNQIFIPGQIEQISSSQQIAQNFEQNQKLKTLNKNQFPVNEFLKQDQQLKNQNNFKLSQTNKIQQNSSYFRQSPLSNIKLRILPESQSFSFSDSREIMKLNKIVNHNPNQTEELLLGNSFENFFKIKNFERHAADQKNEKPLIMPSQALDSLAPKIVKKVTKKKQLNLLQPKMIIKNNSQQAQDFQKIPCIFHRQSTQDQSLMKGLNSKIAQITQEMKKAKNYSEQKQMILQKCKQYENKIKLYCQQINHLTQTLNFTQNKLNKIQSLNCQQQIEYQNILEEKDEEISALLREINQHRIRAIQQNNFSAENQIFQTLIEEKLAQINQIKSDHARSIKDMKQKLKNSQIQIKQLQDLLNQKDNLINKLKQEYFISKDQNLVLFRKIQTMKQQLFRSNSTLLDRSRQQINKKDSLTNSKNKQLSPNHLNRDEQRRQLAENRQKIKSNTGRANRFKQFPEKFTNFGSSKIIYEEDDLQSKKFSQCDDSIDLKVVSHIQSMQESFFIEEVYQLDNPKSTFKKYINYENSASAFDDYTTQLERIVLNYEDVIEKQLEMIEELKQKVLQFLKNSLTKQSEAELLESQVFQFQNNLNIIKCQKLDVELQNQRLKKLITCSENKLAALGSKLIRIVKNNKQNPKIHLKELGSFEEML